MSQVAHQVGTYPGFCSMKRLGVFLIPPDGMLVDRRVTYTILNLPVLIYTPEWKEAL